MRCFLPLSFAAVLIVCLGVNPAVCRADDPAPPEQLVEAVSYNLHETPDDPNSPILWTIDLRLAENQMDGGSIGWLITRLTIKAFNDHGTLLDTWIDASPDLNTPDGLWWIEHADPQAPEIAEFVEPPYLEGAAAALNPAHANLEFAFAGLSYTPPPGGPPFETTGGLDYTLTLGGSTEPEAQGEAVEMEVIPTDDPPVG